MDNSDLSLIMQRNREKNSYFYVVFVPDAYKVIPLDTYSDIFEKETDKIIKQFSDFEEFYEYFEFMLNFQDKIIGLNINGDEDFLESYNYLFTDYSIDIEVGADNIKYFCYFFLQPFE